MTDPTLSPAHKGSTVYLVEDDAAVRDSLALLLQLRGFRPVPFDSAEALLAAGAMERPACALVDVRLPGISGLDLQRRLQSQQPALPIVIITAHGDVTTARRALRDGAVDFLEKPIDEAELIDAVTLGLASDAEMIERERGRDAMKSRLARLTPREMEVFERITDGLHNREIAAEFGISPRTVEVHRARIIEKLGARRLSDLFRLRLATDPAAGVAR